MFLIVIYRCVHNLQRERERERKDRKKELFKKNVEKRFIAVQQLMAVNGKLC